MEDDRISLAHGNGGRYMRELIEEVFAKNLVDSKLDVQADAVPIALNGGEVMITTDGRAKILDFGLARREPTEEESQVDSDRRTATQDTKPGTVVGTPVYMSPEQVRGEVADHRSDIFSFGSVLHEMLSGKSAFNTVYAAKLIALALSASDPDTSILSPSRSIDTCVATAS